MLICGRDKTARNTLFRVLGELQAFLQGTIVKPTKVDIVYVSHNPYITPGTLRDQIIYPNTHEDMKKLNIKDTDLLNILDIVDPNRTIISKWKLDETRDWFTCISPRQRQRIAIARLLYHRPLLALFDDCTDLLSEQTEARIYQVCKQLEIT